MLLKNQNKKVQTSLAENCQKVKTDNFSHSFKKHQKNAQHANTDIGQGFQNYPAQTYEFVRSAKAT